MLVTITETMKNGVYLKAATTVVNGQKKTLSAYMIFGGEFRNRLSVFEDGMERSMTIETTESTFTLKGTLGLGTSNLAPVNQKTETVA